MKSSYTGSMTHGVVVHALSRRVRIIAPVLLKDRERACVLEVLLKKRDGIEKVRTVPDIAALVVYFDPEKLPKAALFSLLDALLANLGKRKPAAINSNVAQALVTDGDESGVDKKYKLAINGMSCVSCALLIEMVLKREPRISSAHVLYATESAVVTGRISKETLCTLIDNIGYKAQCNAVDSDDKKRPIDVRQ